MDYPRVNVILDNRRSERYGLILDEFIRQGITNYKIWDAIMLKDIPSSINASHKKIVQWAKDNGESEVLIAEDDLMFPSEKGFEWFLKNKPPLYELYSSANYCAFKRPDKPGAYRCEYQVGFHLYFCHSRYYDTFLNTKSDAHIDSEQRGKLMYHCYPFAALQRPGYSANNQANVNYNAQLTPEDIY